MPELATLVELAYLSSYIVCSVVSCPNPKTLAVYHCIMSVDYDGEPQQQQLDSGLAGGGVTVQPGGALLALLMTILAMVYVYVHYRYVYRRHGEPPLLSGTIPWWGHAATFGKDPCQFVTDMKKKHGSVFTVVAAGNRVLLLCDYRHVVAFQRESKALSGAELKMEMTAKIFGAQMARADQVLLQDHRASYINHLSGAPLAELVSAYQDTLRSFLCLPEVPGCTAPRHNPYDVEAELELTRETSSGRSWIYARSFRGRLLLVQPMPYLATVHTAPSSWRTIRSSMIMSCCCLEACHRGFLA